MATNLRLRPDAEAAVRAEAQRSGRSQQEVIRDAIDRQLGLTARTDGSRHDEALIASGAVRPPREPFRAAATRIEPPAGVTTLDLLAREERRLIDPLR
jgi:hypothetical protein